MNDNQILIELSKTIGSVEGSKSHSFTKQELVDKINELINFDFQRLVSILYRLDISESKLKLLLKENPNVNAGLIIADLMIERQLQKLRSRQQYKRDAAKLRIFPKMPQKIQPVHLWHVEIANDEVRRKLALFEHFHAFLPVTTGNHIITLLVQYHLQQSHNIRIVIKQHNLCHWYLLYSLVYLS